MNKIINLFKTFWILGLILLFAFYFYKSEYNPYPVKNAQLVDIRAEASFLNLNEAVILELKDKQEYDKINEIEKKELGKEWLFEEIDKKDYNF